jgi:hypothetical protein
MAVELRDLRAKVTPLTDVALEAEARAFGLEKSELVRDILEAWAGKKVHAARRRAHVGSEGCSPASADASSASSAPACGIWQSEIDPYASAVLRKHWPEVPNHGDIRNGSLFFALAERNRAEPEVPNHGDIPTSSAGASPVRTSATRASVPASTANGLDCGASTPELLASYDPATSSWRTSQLCLDGGLSEFSETWPRSGLMRSGTAYRLPPLVPLTNATGFSLWPTPVKSDGQARRPSKGWDGTDLPSVVWRRCGGDQNPEKPPAKLNPVWVEWLMGFDPEWTALDASARRS